MDIPYHKRAATIIIKDKEILLMHRHKAGQEYYALPGGTLEAGESPEQAAIREVKEETTLDIAIDKLLWEYDDKICYGYYFLAKDIKGQAQLGGEELERNNPDNHYALKWVKIADLPKLLLYPETIAKRIYKAYS